MKLPDFMIIGAFKGGNKSLWYYLKEHPEIFMCPIDETRYFSYYGKQINYKGPGDTKFNNKSITIFDEYKRLFNGVKNEKVIGESSSIYFYKRETAERIKSIIPEMKFIICLKNPVERAFSNFIQKRRNGEEFIKSFENALLQENKRKINNYSPAWYYLEKGFYYDCLKNYLEIFNKDQIKVYLFEDIVDNPQNVINNIFGFLEVSKNFMPDTKVNIDETFLPKSTHFHSILKHRWVISKNTKNFLPSSLNQKLTLLLKKFWENNKINPQLSVETKTNLLKIYREDILKTQKLINMDLSSWLR